MNRLKNFSLLFIATIMILSCNSEEKNNVIDIEYPEVYELSNIILALTEYGKTDRWQVRKDFPYYEKMRSFFKPFENHPLLDSVNFSKKRWKEYLSFRTDAYAFEFNQKGELKRTNNFQAFEIKTFDRFLNLVQDFSDVSDFRTFFKENKAYYHQIVSNYQEEYMLKEMKQFLDNEFGSFFSKKKYRVVLSPFVYAQNLHRDVDSLTTADFPSLALSIINGKNKMSNQEKSTEIHTLFTEMDHGYVNPITEKNQALVLESFQSNWSLESGYEKYPNAVFNEYLTWATYDIFNQKYFPELAQQINLYWHFQNDSRGFLYSYFFAEKLKELYTNKKSNQKIKDLYPALLKWTDSIAPYLSKPTITFPIKVDSVNFSHKTLVKVSFTEAMKKSQEITILTQNLKGIKDTIRLDKKHALSWSKNGKQLSFQLNLSEKEKAIYLIFNWWGTKHPLISKKGILLKSSSYFKIQDIINTK